MDLSCKIDLHMHTTVSDGTDAPGEIVARVREAGIGLFSVTDHDAVKASEANQAAKPRRAAACFAGVRTPYAPPKKAAAIAAAFLCGAF
jgi:predicted metal-dependent phosphoesterase TrpH